MSLCKHAFVGSPLPSGKSVRKARVARNGVVYSFNGCSSIVGQSNLVALRLLFIASLSRWSFLGCGRKLFVSVSQLWTSSPVAIVSVSLSTAFGSPKVSSVWILEGMPLAVFNVFFLFLMPKFLMYLNQ